MMNRRDVLRLSALAVLGTSLAACSGRGAPDRPAPSAGPAEDISLAAADVGRTPGDLDAIGSVVSGIQAFGGELYGAVVGAADAPGNLVMSPYSVAVALGMTMAGAAGRTASEMRNLLGADASFHAGLNALSSAIDGLAGPQVRSDGKNVQVAVAGADQLFGQRGVQWSDDFLELLAREYGAGMRMVDFESAAEQARLLINDWVERETHDKISDLIPGGVLDALTRLVLVNAIYLSAPWDVPFEEPLTSTKPFRLLDGSVVHADMMQSSEAVAAVRREDGWASVRLPYAGRGLAMTIVLPDEDRFAEIERRLVGGGLGEMIAGGQSEPLSLWLPRWTCRSAVPMNDALEQLGMRTAFKDGSADFTPMTDEDLPLHISAVLHQGYIAVDEKGTEASAATAVVVSLDSARLSSGQFHADRPFLYVVHDVEHGTPLFLGRVTDPTQGS